jgi:hypothetical protein
MNKKFVWIIVCAAVGFVGALVYNTMSYSQHRVEVCMVFEGRENCRTALGGTKEAALRMAVDNACATISSGMTQTIACGNTTPKSVKWLER